MNNIIENWHKIDNKHEGVLDNNSVKTVIKNVFKKYKSKLFEFLHYSIIIMFIIII